MENNQKDLRQLVLKTIYDLSECNCGKRINFNIIADYFKTKKNIEWEQLLPSISYLDQKRLINSKLIESIDGKTMYVDTAITTEGIELIESEHETEEKLKTPQNTYTTYNNSTIISGNQNQVEVNYNGVDIQSIAESLNQLVMQNPENDLLKIAAEEVRHSSERAVNWKLIGSIMKPFSTVLPSILTAGAMRLLGF